MQRTATIIICCLLLTSLPGFGQPMALMLVACSNSASKSQPEIYADSPARRQSAALKEQLKDDIFALASKSRSSTEDYARAGEYVRLQAKAVGLDAKMETVKDVSQWKRGKSDKCELISPTGARTDLPIVALADSEAGDVEGEVILVNYFFDKCQGPPPRRFNEGAKPGEKRIVYFSRPLKESPSLKQYIEAVVQRNHGASWAAYYGADAVLVRSVQTGNGPPHGGAVTYDDRVARKIPAAALSLEAAKLLEDQLKDGKSSVRVHLKTTSTREIRKQDNVIISISGKTRPEEIVLLGAHLDSHDITPGAADDAAGVASVLAVMREFARNPPARTVLIVLFADEEVSLSGGRAFAESHKKELSQIVAAIEMDDGDGAPRALHITSPEDKTDAAIRSLRQIVDSVGYEANGLELHTGTGTYGSDLEILWDEYGIPEIAILQDLKTYFNRHHAENDKPEDVNLDGLERTTSLLIRIMDVLASGAMKPLKIDAPPKQNEPCPL